MTRTGVVLSGGGIRGFAHLGLLQVMQECGIKPHAISGVSAGAIVGTFYAAGLEPQQIMEILKKNSYFGWSAFSLLKDGFFSMKSLANTLKIYVPHDSFSQLGTPLFITATDFTNNCPVVFSKGNLFEAVIASASVPIIFEPVRIGNSLFVDGGLLDNFPVEPLAGICDRVVGCHVNNIETGAASEKPIGKINIIEKCFHMAIAGSIYEKAKKCDLFIEPDLHGFGMFDMQKSDIIYEIGYRTALTYKDRLLELAA
jgi:NTE family protein